MRVIFNENGETIFARYDKDDLWKLLSEGSLVELPIPAEKIYKVCRVLSIVHNPYDLEDGPMVTFNVSVTKTRELVMRRYK